MWFTKFIAIGGTLRTKDCTPDEFDDLFIMENERRRLVRIRDEERRREMKNK